MSDDIIEFCSEVYHRQLEERLAEFTGGRTVSCAKLEKMTSEARKRAIEEAFIQGVVRYPKIEPNQIWEAIYIAHVKAKSGIDNPAVIDKVVSSHQSWIKSSGHAYEEIIKSKGTETLSPRNIKIVLQRDLTDMLKNNELANEPRDLEMFGRMKNGTFDLYALVSPDGENNYCFGCIQCKTSVRERVKGDREPSLQAMSAFFWSTIFVLNGDFLRLPEFIEMVNGGTVKFPENGWHGMYVFSHLNQNDRIYPTNLDFANFRDHAVQAADMWLHQRQWLNSAWKAKND